MNAQQLKNSILQMAVQGKLVPQNPNDEPANVLLERIRKEKEQLIKEKKIKKEKNPSYIFRGTDNLPYEKVGNQEPVCIADKVPFEIPDSWEWVRLKNLSIKIGAGSTPQGGKNIYVSKGIKFIRSQNVYNNGLYLKNVVYIPEEINAKKAGSVVHPKDILLNITGGSIGRCAIVPEQFDIGNVNQHVMIIRLIKAEIRNWIHFVLVSDYIQKLIMEVQVGVSREGLSASKLKDFLIPIPPLSELKRIVDKIEHLLPYIEKYKSLEESKQSLDKKFPNKLKSAILQWAVQGKLVKQDANDESAKLLLNHIHQEKVELLNKGKIKKDKHESVIFRRDNSYYEKLDGKERCIDAEIPFEIPENWEWSRIGNIFFLQAGKNIQAAKIKKSPFKNSFLCYGGNGMRGYVEQFNRSGDYPIIGRQGALCGNINRANGKFYATEHAICVKTFAGTCVEWACLFLKALNLNQYATATAQPGLSVAKINKILIPVPPLNEQKRICIKFNFCIEQIELL